jgi:hypothetical protein
MSAIRPAPRNTSFEQPAMADTGAGSYYGNVALDALYHSPVPGSYRMSELFLEKHFGDSGKQSDKISPQQASEQYGLDGELKFDEPVFESYARLLHDRKLAELRREYELTSGGEGHWGRKLTGFGVGMVSSVIDPVNLASMFIPIVGQSRFLSGAKGGVSLLEKGLVSPRGVVKMVGGNRLGVRLATGAIEGSVGSVLVEPLNIIPSLQEQANYDYKDSLLNVVFGGTMGATIHAGGGWLGDKWKAMHESLRVMEPQTHEAAVMGAVSDIIQDSPVESPADVISVDPHFIERELQEVNTANMFKIAQEHYDRLEQLNLQGRLTPAQDIRRKLIGAILRNPTDATPENLAALFELKLNDDVSKMPGAFRHAEGFQEVKAPKEKPTPIEYSEEKFQELFNRVNEALAEAGDDYTPNEYIANNPKDFKALVKKLIKAGYDVFDKDSTFSSGSEALAILMKDKVVKISVSKFKPMKGISLPAEFQTKAGEFHARVVERVTPLEKSDFSIGDKNSLFNDNIYQAFQMLSFKYGLSPDDLLGYNLGITKDGRLIILDEGAAEKRFRANRGKLFQAEKAKASSDAINIFNELVKQIEAEKAKTQSRTVDKVKQIIKRREQKPTSEQISLDPKPELDKALGAEARAEKPAQTSPKMEEKVKTTEDTSAKVKEETQILEQDLSDMSDQDKELLAKFDEEIAAATKLDKAIRAGTECVVNKII